MERKALKVQSSATLPLDRCAHYCLQQQVNCAGLLHAILKTLHEPSEGYVTIFDHLPRSMLAIIPNSVQAVPSILHRYNFTNSNFQCQRLGWRKLRNICKWITQLCLVSGYFFILVLRVRTQFENLAIKS